MLLNLFSYLRIVFFLTLAHVSSAIEKPNIIIFYVDDLGWQDIQLNDLDSPCAYDTPNISKLASSGMNMTQGYSPAPTCSPSRAAIITGQHPAQIGLTHVNLGVIKPNKKHELLASPYLEGHLNTNLMTLADALKLNGYRTGHSGKWHVGLTAHNYGFDIVNQDRGVHRRMKNRTKNFSTENDNEYPLSKQKYFPKTQNSPKGISYPYDEVTESAIKYMDDHKAAPFFLNLCHWMVHWPMLTRNGELLKYYCDKFEQPFPPKEGDMTESGQKNPYFAAMVTTVDWSLGRVVNYLEQTDDPRHPGKKLIETTYIFFTSDNGGAEIRGDEVLSDNAPLKYGKKHTEEGGVRVPMIITGPSIKGGTKYDGLVNQLDYFPTILKLTNSSIKAENYSKLSGLDITAVLRSKSQDIMNKEGVPRNHLFWHFPHGNMKSSIRLGDFKLYKQYLSGDYELYRLYKNGKRHDLEEATNLAKIPKFQTELDKLSKTLADELTTVNAEKPYLNPNYKDKKIPSLNIASAIIKTSGREIKVSFPKTEPMIKKAFTVYKHTQTKKKRAKVKSSQLDEMMNMKYPAHIGEDNRSITAQLPEGISSAVFVIIDEHNYIHYTPLVSLKL